MPLNHHYRKSTVYSNGLVIGQNGIPVCTLNGKRLDWYLKRGLAEEITPPKGYSRAIQLNFLPKFNREPQNYELAIIKNECCLCGTPEKLTVHHVVPKVIRKKFPLNQKGRARQWCLLLCLDCHKKVEETTQAVYKVNYPDGVVPMVDRDRILLRRLKGWGLLDRVQAHKYQRLMESAGYANAEEIPGPPTKQESDDLLKLYRKAIDDWALNFIETHGGVEGVKKYFRELFLSFRPIYLPPGYLDIFSDTTRSEAK